MTMVPMFPLGSVLVPYEVMPLHVFETRYRMLVQDCLAGDGRFGIVLIERGSEVGGGDVRFDAGCMASIVQAEEQPDGRWFVVAAGTQPLRVREWLADDPYPRADVEAVTEMWTEGSSAALDRAIAAFGRVVDLARRLGGAVDATVLDLTGEPELDQWALVARAPIGALDKQAVLAADGPEARLRLLAGHLTDVAGVLASRLSGG